MVGQERVDMVNLTIDELIEGGHSESAAMAEWKDGINESWADLLELIDTRAQLLATSYELLKYERKEKKKSIGCRCGGLGGAEGGGRREGRDLRGSGL